MPISPAGRWRPVGAIHRNEPYLHAAARRFIDILKDCSSDHRLDERTQVPRQAR
jgi:DNA-binding transcriptional LysR family regulator